MLAWAVHMLKPARVSFFAAPLPIEEGAEVRSGACEGFAGSSALPIDRRSLLGSSHPRSTSVALIARLCDGHFLDTLAEVWAIVRY